MDTRGQSILIVDDDRPLGESLRDYLAAHGFAVHIEERGDRAVERICRERPAMVILDLELPGLHGLEVCRQARESYTGGILILTASTTEIDQTVGLELGADDYVAKPADPRLLLARIRSLMRRLSGVPSTDPPQATLSVAGLEVDHATREMRFQGERISLTAQEFDVMWLLARHAGEVVSRDDLHRKVRGTEYDGIDRGIDIHVSRIRRKLECHGVGRSAIKSVRNAGYLLVNPE